MMLGANWFRWCSATGVFVYVKELKSLRERKQCTPGPMQIYIHSPLSKSWFSDRGSVVGYKLVTDKVQA